MAALALLGAGSAFAQINPACPNCEGDPRELAEEVMLDVLPLSLWLDQTTYGGGDVITITGHVANVVPDVPITIVIHAPSGNIVWVGQVDLNGVDTFEIQVTSGSWSELGLYQVLAQYGHPSRDNKAQFTLTEPSMESQTMTGCGPSMVAVEDICVAYEIKGGMITGVVVNQADTSLVLHMSSSDNGMLSVTFPTEVLDGVFLVLVDGEESDDLMIDGQSVHVYFPAGAESVEFFAATVIPEFGVITVLILAVALVSVVAVSARSRLGLVPRA